MHRLTIGPRLYQIFPATHGLGSFIKVDTFFPYGRDVGDLLLTPGDDSDSEPLRPNQSLHFYDGTISTLFVTTNGMIATSKPPPEDDYLEQFPPDFGLIAPFLSDIDTSEGGNVFYREDTSQDVLHLASKHINRGFPGSTFIPKSALVFTWEDVLPYYSQRGDAIPHNKGNTFQAVLASDESKSYAIFLYPEDGLNFHGTQPKNNYNEENSARVGFSKGAEAFILWKTKGPHNEFANDYYSLEMLRWKTNSGMQGVWIYEIGGPSTLKSVVAANVEHFATLDEKEENHSEETEDFNDHYVTEQDYENNPLKPNIPGLNLIPVDPYLDQEDVILGNVNFQVPSFPQNNPQIVIVDDELEDTGVVFQYNTGNQQTCANNRHQCSSQAFCKDYSTGFCCTCIPGYYGNGRQCVAEGSPQRVNGKVKGKIYVGSNPIPVVFEGIDLHSYVVVNDGRAYTAISTIADSLGYSLLPLASIGGVIGWMFSVQQPGYKNGFSITGGEFTRKTEVTFLHSNKKLVILQKFSGIDEHGHLTISTELDGSVPEIPYGSTVHIEPYTELYQTSSSVITSSSNREYTVEFPQDGSETFTYQWKQTITFTECVHDTAAPTVPAIQQLSVDRVFVLYNREEKILRYASSNSIGPITDSPVDTNRNPCYIGAHNCDTNAVCRPAQGNQYICECTSGFRGDGRTCYEIDECQEQQDICGDNAICNNQPGTFRCECNDGYQFLEDGRTCASVERTINHCLTGTHNCDIAERAHCIYTGGSSYICACLSGYSGDGRVCEDVDECETSQCHPDAVCYNIPGSFSCHCKPGYQGNGFQCFPGEPQKTPCQLHQDSILGSPSVRGARPVGQFLPQCDESGNYVPRQCHSGSGYCWCVDKDGNELPGTRTRPGLSPPCLDIVTHPPPTVGPVVRPDVAPLPPGTHLLFVQSGKIEHVPLEGNSMKKSDAKTLLHIPDKVIIGVSYDCVDKTVYWTDITGPSISRASINGGEPTAIIKTELGSPEGIAVDHLGRNIFWTDSVLNTIEVAKLDGSNRRILFDTDLENPRGIVADALKGNLYWTDWNRVAPKIETSYMDGTNRRILVKDDLGLPNGLTIDAYSSMLCWVDAGTKRMECMNPSQPARRKIVEGIQYPFGITSYGKNIFYTDWKRDSIVAIDRTISKENDNFQPPKRSRLYGITTAYSQCPQGQNYCAVNNGGCKHLCLATPGGRSCLCPENSTGVDCLDRN
ncbi:nidogen-1 isoform X2 [Xenopus laevis]|uniref:Nidogen-1 isoform X2 n=1 Tax=Xenopus laevis TaxID=8355 RepID=A0A8J1KN38_XENLA|nr:nidogen-1 isoform X2 [Xenopus laevis]